MLTVSSKKVVAQAPAFPVYFKNDSLAVFHLVSTNGQKFKYTATNKLACFIFLSPDCPLCKNYAVLINNLKQQYSASVAFYLIVPGTLYSMDEIKSFSKGYLKNAVLYKDASLDLARYLRATVTPEVVLLEGKTGKTIYAGALDNWAVSLGRQRSKATANYLRDALESSLHHQPPVVTFKEPVGCFINDF